MKYNPERMTIGQILSMTNPPVLVPDWQRNFSWTTTEVETFWQDLLRFNEQYLDENIEGQEYFLGAIVIVDTKKANLLLDGQQRIATSAILLSVIRDFLSKYNRDAALRVSTRYLTDYDDALEDFTYKITLNRFDRDFFKREILETRDKNYSPPEPIYESHYLIRKAKNFFNSKFSEKYNKINDQQLSHKWALRILKILTNHVSVVGVISLDENNASTVFETLNDRGIGLSTTDLLRNLIMRRAKDYYIDELMDLWGEILEVESDSKLQDFFRHFWISRESDVKARSLFREVKDKVSNNNIDSLEFSRALRDSSNIYSMIINAEFAEDPDIENYLESINELSAKVLLPPTLSVLETISDFESIKKYLSYFIIAYVRHTLVGKKENSLIENIMFSIAKSIRDSGKFNQSHLDQLIEFSPSDEEFEHSLSIVSISRIASVRYLFKQIELYKRSTEELDVSIPSRVHVEHIYPKKPEDEQKFDSHDSIVNRLGNLTLLSARLNMSVKNKAYEYKKEYYNKSELYITKEIADKYEDWGIEQINLRQKELAEMAVKIWSF